MTAAEKIQKEIDHCDVIHCALCRVYGLGGNWRITSMSGRLAGLKFALATAYPGLNGGRVYPLDNKAHEAEIAALVKQYELEDHERWLKEERGQ